MTYDLNTPVWQTYTTHSTCFIFYKNVEAQKCPFFTNIVVILFVATSISFEPQDRI